MTRLLSLLFALALLLGSAPTIAQITPSADVSAQITQAEKDLRTITRELESRDTPEDIKEFRATAVAAQQTIRSSSTSLAEQLASVEARIAGLGPPPEGIEEAPEIKRERERLAESRATIDGAIKRGKLVELEAQQLLDELQKNQTAQLNKELTTRVNSPLAPDFWAAIIDAMPRDLRRIDYFLTQGAKQSLESWNRGLPWQGILAMLAAVTLILPVRIYLGHLAQRYLIGTTPGHRVRRSGYALCRLLIGTAAPSIAAVIFAQGIRWSRLLPNRWDSWLDGFVVASGLSAFIVAVFSAVLMAHQPTWRVTPIRDDTAHRLQAFSWPLATIAFCCTIVEAFNQSVGASAAARTATEVTESLFYLLWIGAFLLVIGRLRAKRLDQQDQDEDESATATSTGLSALSLVTWLMIVAAMLGLAMGYVSFSLFLAKLIIWILLLGATLYLLMKGADDIATTAFQRDSRLGQTLVRSVGVRPSLVDQFGVLLSGTLKLTLVALALGALMSPFGGGGGLTSLFARIGTLSQGIAIGGLAISPGAIIRAIVVLVLGLALVRAFMNWLDHRFLPATDLDGSGRNSISMVARYVGIALAIIWALASLGIGVERIAILLSALSVGIGFGLQAITQNFVSGLILLAERPIKIGDWIRVGADEGDVKRISVRSTEITLADHSTLIVPNSELITKSVLNKTLSSPLGRISIVFTVPIETDAEEVIAIMLATFAEESNILEDPKPKVFIEGIAEGRIAFKAFANVPSPRDVYSARSNALRKLLIKLRKEGIEIGTGPQKIEITPAEFSSVEPGHGKA